MNLKWIRIGRRRPWPTFGNRHDSHHPGPSDWDIDGYYGYVSPEFWKELQEFQNFRLPNDAKIPVVSTEDLLSGKQIPGIHDQPWYQQMCRLIKRAGGYQVWQFNMIDDPRLMQPEWEYRRAFIGLGEKNGLRRWSWFDLYIQLPFARLLVKILNRIDRPRQLREQASIEAWRKEMHRGRVKNEDKNG